MDNSRWEQFARGVGCPLDAPRPHSNEHWDFVTAFSVSSLYLSKNQTYRGHCQLIFDPRHAARVDQLSGSKRRALSADLFRAQAAIMRTDRADHFNVESLGNLVPHVHWHIVPRYRGDPRWGSPIWLTSLDEMIDTRLSGDEHRALMASVKEACEAESQS
jgi:diadenosine tetraphosphate (Ap4A) HIT family hydrolase